MYVNPILCTTKANCTVDSPTNTVTLPPQYTPIQIPSADTQTEPRNDNLGVFCVRLAFYWFSTFCKEGIAEKPAKTQTSFRLASHLVIAVITPKLEDLSRIPCGNTNPGTPKVS
jgi:hypothetical protein